MLIPSPRHRPEDLELWTEYEGVDRIHASSHAVLKRIAQTEEKIHCELGKRSYYISMSWGKDSIVMADLVLRVAPETVVAHVTAGSIWDPPEKCACINAFSHIHPTINYMEYTCDYGGVAPGMPIEVLLYRTYDFIATAKRVSKQLGSPIFGMRAEESRARNLSRRRNGLVNRRSFWPIADWRTKDVFAYLHYRRLPVPSQYAMLGGGRYEREYIRTDILFGPEGRDMGRLEWEAEYYPDIYNRLDARL